MSPRHLPEHVPARFSWKAVRANSARAQRRLSALRRACALGGVSLAVLAGAATADAQSARGVRIGSAPTVKPGVVEARAAASDAPTWASQASSLAPTFSPAATPTGLTVAPGTGVPTSYVTPTVADFDRDGDLDVLVGGNTGTFVYFQNTAGAGNPPTYGPQVAPAPFGLVAPYGEAFNAPAAIDIDGDGDVDVVAGTNYGDIGIFLNTAAPGATPVFAPPTYTADFGAFSSPAVGDLDGDGDVDLLVGLSTGSFVYSQNTAGRGNPPVFAAAPLPAGLADLGPADEFSQPTFGDFDRDGDLDLLVVNGLTGNFFYFRNTAALGAAPTFDPAVSPPFGLPDLGDSGTQPAVGDLDGDGDLDVLSTAGKATTALQYFRNSDTSALTATLAGTEGWRMLASPVPTATLATLLGPIATQGVPGADNAAGDPNVFVYNEPTAGVQTNGYVAPATLAAAAGAGKGYFVYVFTDDDSATPGTQGSFPKTLSVTGASAASPFTFAPTFTATTGGAADDGWNLLGNPFNRWFDWDAAAKTNLDASVYVYNPATSAYLAWNGTAGGLSGGIVAPFQGFWAKASAAAPALRASAPVGASGGPFRGRDAGDVASVIGLSLRRADGTPMRAEAFVTFGQPDAAAGVDALDAYALTAPDAEHLTLATEATGPDGAVALAIDARPMPDGAASVSVQAAATTAGDMVLSWPTLDSLPAEWTVELRDTVTGAVVDLRAATEYPFALAATPALSGTTPAARRAEATAPRFTLVVGRGAVAGEAPADAAFALSAPRPNPTAGGAALDLDLAQAATVSVGVYDALGRRVATLAEGSQPAGRLALRVADGALAAGVYIVRAEIGGATVLTQRLVVTR